MKISVSSILFIKTKKVFTILFLIRDPRKCDSYLKNAPADAQRFEQLIHQTAKHAVNPSSGYLKTLDVALLLENLREDDAVKGDAIREACRALRRKCVERRVLGSHIIVAFERMDV